MSEVLSVSGSPPFKGELLQRVDCPNCARRYTLFRDRDRCCPGCGVYHYYAPTQLVLTMSDAA